MLWGERSGAKKAYIYDQLFGQMNYDDDDDDDELYKLKLNF